MKDIDIGLLNIIFSELDIVACLRRLSIVELRYRAQECDARDDAQKKRKPGLKNTFSPPCISAVK
jgi:hypothetical protein